MRRFTCGTVVVVIVGAVLSVPIGIIHAGLRNRYSYKRLSG